MKSNILSKVDIMLFEMIDISNLTPQTLDQESDDAYFLRSDSVQAFKETIAYKVMHGINRQLPVLIPFRVGSKIYTVLKNDGLQVFTNSYQSLQESYPTQLEEIFPLRALGTTTALLWGSIIVKGRKGAKHWAREKMNDKLLTRNHIKTVQSKEIVQALVEQGEKDIRHFDDLLEKLSLYIPPDQVTHVLKKSNDSGYFIVGSKNICIATGNPSNIFDKMLGSRENAIKMVMCHELIHSLILLEDLSSIDEEDATTYKTNAGPGKRLCAIYSSLKKYRGDFSDATNNGYYLTNVDEMITGFFTDPYFQEWIFRLDNGKTAEKIANNVKRLTQKDIFVRLSTPDNFDNVVYK